MEKVVFQVIVISSFSLKSSRWNQILRQLKKKLPLQSCQSQRRRSCNMQPTRKMTKNRWSKKSLNR